MRDPARWHRCEPVPGAETVLSDVRMVFFRLNPGCLHGTLMGHLRPMLVGLVDSWSSSTWRSTSDSRR